LVAALQAVLPPSTALHLADTKDQDTAIVELGDRQLAARWVGRGSARTVRQALELPPRPDVIVGSELSLAARNVASQAHVGWVDESGAAEIAIGTIVVSRSGRPRGTRTKPTAWTRTVLSVAEAILCGTPATVSTTAQATGHSMSSAAYALAALTGLGLLEASARRGRHSGRRVNDPDRLLEQYADAAQRLRSTAELRCGVLWRDPLAGLTQLGKHWTQAGVPWAATGSLGAEVLAPFLSNTTGGEVYVAAGSEPGLYNAARAAGLEPIEGGRLLLRPFPTAASDRLATEVDGVWVAPWPRVYADVRDAGVRGEEAAEHLREVVGGG
jgi:hypothetical protein